MPTPELRRRAALAVSPDTLTHKSRATGGLMVVAICWPKARGDRHSKLLTRGGPHERADSAADGDSVTDSRSACGTCLPLSLAGVVPLVGMLRGPTRSVGRRTTPAEASRDDSASCGLNHLVNRRCIDCCARWIVDQVERVLEATGCSRCTAFGKPAPSAMWPSGSCATHDQRWASTERLRVDDLAEELVPSDIRSKRRVFSHGVSETRPRVAFNTTRVRVPRIVRHLC
jgi:hypothetical protein